MGAPVFYSHRDAGAPVWLAGRHGMREILLGCLVNGYGSKPGAGWSVVYDDWANSGNFSITNAAQSGVLGLWHSGHELADYGPVMYVAEGMQSASQPLQARSGVLSITDTTGLDYSNTCSSGHCAGFNTAVDGMEWALVANENFAVLFMSRKSSSGVSAQFHGNPQPFFSYSYGNPDMLCFGAINTAYGLGDSSAPLPGNFFLIGAGIGSYYAYSVDWINGNLPVSHTRMRDGSLVTARRYGMMSPLAGVQYPGEEVDEVELRPLRLYIAAVVPSGPFGGATQYGRLPGCFAYGDIGRYRDASDFAFFNPGVESFAGVLLIGGRNCLYGVVGNTNPVFVSLDAADW